MDAREETLRAASSKLLSVLYARHYGRMPDEVQAAIYELEAALAAPAPQTGWQPLKHDIGDDIRAAIVRALMEQWQNEPDLSPERVRHLAMWGAAAVRALLYELGTLRDMTAPPAPSPQEDR